MTTVHNYQLICQMRECTCIPADIEGSLNGGENRCVIGEKRDVPWAEAHYWLPTVGHKNKHRRSMSAELSFKSESPTMFLRLAGLIQAAKRTDLTRPSNLNSSRQIGSTQSWLPFWKRRKRSNYLSREKLTAWRKARLKWLVGCVTRRPLGVSTSSWIANNVWLEWGGVGSFSLCTDSKVRNGPLSRIWPLWQTQATAC